MSTPGDDNTQIEELRVVVERLKTENGRLRVSIEERESVIRSLTESLAIARTESELFQKRWAEAQVRAQSLGVDFTDQDATETQRQLIEAVRAMYIVESERQRLAQAMQRLLAALEANREIDSELRAARELLSTLDVGSGPTAKEGPGKLPEAGLESASVLDVNQSLRLVVLNIGWFHGTRVGMPLVLMRGDRVIGELKVVEVRRRVCGAVIESLEKNVTVTAGDTARVPRG